MTTFQDTPHHFSLFVEGRGYAGQVADYAPPNLEAARAQRRAARFTVTAYDADVLALFGVVEGNRVAVCCRGTREEACGGR
jgi:phage tail tube protein FII